MADGYTGPAMFEFDGVSIEVSAHLTADAGGWGGVLMVGGDDADDLFQDAFGQAPSRILLSGNAVGIVKIDGIGPGQARVTGISPTPF